VITITGSSLSRIFTGPQNAKFNGSKYVSTKIRNIKGNAKMYGFTVVDFNPDTPTQVLTAF